MVIGQRSSQVTLKTPQEVEQMRVPGRMVGETLQELAEMVKPGVSLAALDRYVIEKFGRLGVTPTFKDYDPGIYPYPYTICASVNEQIVHGFPVDRTLEEGEILSIDLGATMNGWVADSALTVGVGTVSREAQRLMDVTRESLDAGIAAARGGTHKGDIGAAIQEVLEGGGFGVVRGYTGHGVGRQMHEPPSVPNYGRPGSGMLMRPGMVVALEPMATVGSPETRVLDDQWTVVTEDGSLAAHFEHTMALREDQAADVLTRVT